MSATAPEVVGYIIPIVLNEEFSEKNAGLTVDQQVQFTLRDGGLGPMLDEAGIERSSEQDAIFKTVVASEVSVVADTASAESRKARIKNDVKGTVATFLGALGFVPAIGNQALADGAGSNGPPAAAGSQTPFKVNPNSVPSLNVTVTNTQNPGFFTLLRPGEVPGLRSDFNSDHRLQTRAAYSVAKSDAAGTVNLFTQSGANEIVDLTGYFAPGTTTDATFDRFDSRKIDNVLIPADSFVEFKGPADTTMMINVTAVDTVESGYVALMPKPDRSLVGSYSNLDVDKGGAIVSAVAVVTFGPDGKYYAYTQKQLELVVDPVTGIANGKFIDIPDQRLVDTRSGRKPDANSDVIISGGLPDTDAQVRFIMTEPEGQGYGQAKPVGAPSGTDSTINTEYAGQTVANTATIHFNEKGEYAMHVQPKTHVVADVQGYWTNGAYIDIPNVRVLDDRIEEPGDTINPVNPADVSFSCNVLQSGQFYSQKYTLRVSNMIPDTTPFNGIREGQYLKEEILINGVVRESNSSYVANTTGIVESTTTRSMDSLEAAAHFIGRIRFSKYNEATKDSPEQYVQSMVDVSADCTR